MTTATSTATEQRLREALENILADCEIAQERRTLADFDFATCHAVEYAREALTEKRDEQRLTS